MKGGVVLGRGAEGCVIAINETEVVKVLFVEPPWQKRGMSNAEYMTLQQKIREIDPEEDQFVTTKRLVQAPLSTLPADLQRDIQSCHSQFRFESSLSPLNGSSTITMYVQTRVRNTNVYGWKEDDFFHIWNAVRLLHQNGVAHGDIHEQNFAKNAKGLPVLIDFDHAQTTQQEMPYFVWHTKSRYPSLEQSNQPNQLFTFRPGSTNFADFVSLQKVFYDIEMSKMR